MSSQKERPLQDLETRWNDERFKDRDPGSNAPAGLDALREMNDRVRKAADCKSKRLRLPQHAV